MFAAKTNVSPKPKFMPGIRRRLERSRELQSVVDQMKQTFKRLVEQSDFDLILFHGKSVFPVIEGFSGLPMVVDFCDATSLRLRGRMKFSSVKSLPWLWLRYLQVRAIEKKLVRKTPFQAFITSRDRDAIVGHDANVRIIPNVVDLDYWKRKTHSPEPNCVMYSGGMNYRPNVDGALFLMRKVLPLLRKHRPNVRVIIVGRDPTPEIIETAKKCPEVTVTGAVDDMRPYFEKAAVYACPLRFASGQQNKLIEAMAMEVPTVCSSVAAKGMTFDGATQPPLVVADDPQVFADSLNQILDSDALHRQLAKDGRQYIEENFVSVRTVSVLQAMCERAVELR
jgi:glycosyltransferase involved in cell wall biosynthesis